MKPKFLHISLIVLAVILIADCSDSPVPSDSYIRVSITSPQQDTILVVPPVTIKTLIDASCGCQRYVEFHIDDSLHFTDYAGPFEYVWNFPKDSSKHTIRARGVLVGKAVGADSVNVFVR